MRIPRLYLPVPLTPGSEIDLDARAHQHAVKVLRLRAGNHIILFNGEGGEYEATLTSCHKQGAQARIDTFRDTSTESNLAIHLVQGISRGDKMDFTIQKAVELGVAAIYPVNTERSQVKLSGEREEKRLQHWQGVLLHACEQSGRTRIPILHPIRNLEDCLAEAPLPKPHLLLDPRGKDSTRELKGPFDAMTLLAGPEGGLGERDHQLAEQAGFSGLRLGPRILRTETAALAALAALQGQWGDLC